MKPCSVRNREPPHERSNFARFPRRFAWRANRRLPRPRRSWHGGARRSPLHSGPPGARSSRPLELQSREVRLLFRRSQRPSPPHLQNVCHVLREHDMKEQFAGPRFFVRVAGLDMHPLDDRNRAALLKNELGLGLCNITKCCTEVCPEEIRITDNAIIPLKERVVDEFYDPLTMLFRKLRGK